MTLSPSVRNVTRIYRAATDAQKAKGFDWYERARRIAVELDPTNVRRSAAVIALVSPLTPWGRNVWLAREAYRMHAAGDDVATLLPTLKGNARKVARVLNGTDPAAVVSGPKVTPFFLTIADPTNAHAVTVDRHAYDVAVGRVTDDATRSKGIAGKRNQAALEHCYVRAAQILSREEGRTILPSTVQAVTWIAWRETAIRTAAAMRLENVA